MNPYARTEPSEKEGMVELIVGNVMVGYIFKGDAEHVCKLINLGDMVERGADEIEYDLD